MTMDDRRGDALGLHEPEHRQQAVEPGRIEGCSPETIAVVSVGDLGPAFGEVVESGEPARVDRSLTEAGRAVHEAGPLTCHCVLVAPAEVEDPFRQLRSGRWGGP